MDQYSTIEVNSTNASQVHYTHQGFLGAVLPCFQEGDGQHLLFHLAHTCFLLSYLAPSQKRGLLFMHACLIIGFLINSTWAWNVICAPDVFGWSFSLVLLNMGQTLHIIYQMRPVKLNKDLENVYKALFEPLNVSRVLFKRLVSPEYAQVMSLHAGEAYAMSRLTKTDRLGLLFSGQANVISETHFLHTIEPMEFLDSPEFESSRTTREEKFKVSVVAATTCRYIFWQRSNLEYLFVKEQYLASVVLALIARDITNKLYSMNHKIVTEKGSNLDIRLPSLTSSLSSSICDASLIKTSTRRSPAISRKSQRHHVFSSPRTKDPLAASLPMFVQSSQLSLTASPDVIRNHRSTSKRAALYSPAFGPEVIRPRKHKTGGRSRYPTGETPPDTQERNPQRSREENENNK